MSLDGGGRTALLRGGAHGRCAPGGTILYAREGQLLAAPFDGARSRVTGTPEVVVERVVYDARNGGTKIAVAGDGTLAYVADGAGSSAEPRVVLAQGWTRALAPPPATR